MTAHSLVKDVVLQKDNGCFAGFARLAQLHKAGLDVPAGAARCLVKVHYYLYYKSHDDGAPIITAQLSAIQMGGELTLQSGSLACTQQLHGPLEIQVPQHHCIYSASDLYADSAPVPGRHPAPMPRQVRQLHVTRIVMQCLLELLGQMAT